MRHYASTSKGWGIKIDYVKAIAEDRARVALYDGALLRGICMSLTEEERSWVAGNGLYTVSAWVVRYPDRRIERAALTGVTLEEHVCAALVNESDPPDLNSQPEPENWYRRGRDCEKRFAFVAEIVTEERRRKLLSKAKTDLARHTRNQVKYGS